MRPRSCSDRQRKRPLVAELGSLGLRQVDSRVLLIFADGLGLGQSTTQNPLCTVAMPALRRLIGGPLVLDRAGAAALQGADGEQFVLRALDAQLGVPGLPQSATGQATLFTGINAARALSRHVPALPGPKLRALIDQHSLFRVLSSLDPVANQDHPLAFANAFSDAYRSHLENPRARPSASVVAVRAGGVRLRSEEELERAEALPWDITGEYFGRPLRTLRRPNREHSDRPVSSTSSGHLEVASEVAGAATNSTFAGDLAGFERTFSSTARESGRRLAAIARSHRLTLFETFLTDLAGHRRYVVDARIALERLDGLIAGVIDGDRTACDGESALTVIVTSDHGNVEDSSHSSHTSNPVPLLVWGPGAAAFSACQSLADVAPVIARLAGRADAC